MNYAIVTAAGTGSRFGSRKSVHPFRGKTLLAWAILPFEKTPGIAEIVVTYPVDQDESEYAEICHREKFQKVRFIRGGESRAVSVRNAVLAIEDDGIVLIHDAARPLVTLDLIDRVLAASEKYGAAIPALSIQETIKEVDQERVIRTVSRDRLFLAQTPQGFRKEILLAAYTRLGDLDVTDEAALVEKAGYGVRIVPGDRRNIKITEPSDLSLAEFYFKQEAI
jgi:2-C-methyl-D-erythritol 4-phosphate cytidylyltransferase